MLAGIDGKDDGSMQSIGGVTSNDIVRYGERRDKVRGLFQHCVSLTPLQLSERAMTSLLECLDNTLENVVLYYHAVENLDQEHLPSLALSLADDIQADLTRRDLDLRELSTRLSIVLDLYQEATEASRYLRQQFDPHLIK